MEKELGFGGTGLPFADYIRKTFELPDNDIRTYSPLTLAYIGDAIYDLLIRTVIVESGNAPVNKLHKQVSKFVNATAQCDLYHAIKEQLTEEEQSIFKRGRNAKSFTSAKNAGIVEYRTATGMEALVGYLYLTDQTPRIMELLKPQIERMVNIS